jgi:hypothetical protein
MGTDFEVGVIAESEEQARDTAEDKYPGFIYECKGRIFRFLIPKKYGPVN